MQKETEKKTPNTGAGQARGSLPIVTPAFESKKSFSLNTSPAPRASMPNIAPEPKKPSSLGGSPSAGSRLAKTIGRNSAFLDPFELREQLTDIIESTEVNEHQLKEHYDKAQRRSPRSRGRMIGYILAARNRSASPVKSAAAQEIYKQNLSELIMNIKNFHTFKHQKYADQAKVHHDLFLKNFYMMRRALIAKIQAEEPEKPIYKCEDSADRAMIPIKKRAETLFVKDSDKMSAEEFNKFVEGITESEFDL